ncbi:hypothetical protein FTX61_10185 [Nitriliruptoraceae bacterium ZYF776]|nr:hypothetical protein [Profundirhabdus halotolerans]
MLRCSAGRVRGRPPSTRSSSIAGAICGRLHVSSGRPGPVPLRGRRVVVRVGGGSGRAESPRLGGEGGSQARGGLRAVSGSRG